MLLGIDPGTTNIGWAAFSNGHYVDSGLFIARENDGWPQRLADFKRHLAALFAEFPPDVVGIEATQVDQGLWEQAKNGKPVLARLRGQAQLTRQTEELCGIVQGLATECPVVRPTSAAALKAIGLKRGATDRQISEAANRLFGLKLLVKEHHEAIAIGVALAAEKQAKLGKLIGGA